MARRGRSDARGLRQPRRRMRKTTIRGLARSILFLTFVLLPISGATADSAKAKRFYPAPIPYGPNRGHQSKHRRYVTALPSMFNLGAAMKSVSRLGHNRRAKRPHLPEVLPRRWLDETPPAQTCYRANPLCGENMAARQQQQATKRRIMFRPRGPGHQSAAMYPACSLRLSRARFYGSSSQNGEFSRWSINLGSSWHSLSAK